MTEKVAVTLDWVLDEQDDFVYCLKIQGGDGWEMNIWVTEEELKSIPNAKTARWDERGSLKIGKCLNSPTFWSCANGNLSILVGEDDETWEVGITMKEEILEDIVREISNIKNS